MSNFNTDSLFHLFIYSLSLFTPLIASPVVGKPVKFANLAHFAQYAIPLHHFYTAAGGECPGRATVLTGQLPPVHGVRTSLAKTGARSELKVDEVPTLGHYLAQAGYDVGLKGEWGLSEVQAFREHPLLDLLGVERDSGDDLQPFGFQGWEAHRDGDWYRRSLQTTSEAVEYVRRRQSVLSSQSLRGSHPPPWALVVSYGDLTPDLVEPAPVVCEQLVKQHSWNGLGSEYEWIDDEDDEDEEDEEDGILDGYDVDGFDEDDEDDDGYSGGNGFGFGYDFELETECGLGLGSSSSNREGNGRRRERMRGEVMAGNPMNPMN